MVRSGAVRCGSGARVPGCWLEPKPSSGYHAAVASHATICSGKGHLQQVTRRLPLLGTLCHPTCGGLRHFGCSPPPPAASMMIIVYTPSLQSLQSLGPLTPPPAPSHNGHTQSQEKRMAVGVEATERCVCLAVSPQRFTMAVDPLTLRSEECRWLACMRSHAMCHATCMRSHANWQDRLHQVACNGTTASVEPPVLRCPLMLPAERGRGQAGRAVGRACSQRARGRVEGGARAVRRPQRALTAP